MSSVKLLGQDWQPDDWKDRDYIARAYNVKGYTKVTPEHAWVQMYIDAKNNTFGKSKPWTACSGAIAPSDKTPTTLSAKA